MLHHCYLYIPPVLPFIAVIAFPVGHGVTLVVKAAKKKVRVIYTEYGCVLVKRYVLVSNEA
jgi:hypothetical protein